MSSTQDATSPAAPLPEADWRSSLKAFFWRPIAGNREGILLIAGFAAFTVLRFPDVLRHGRFWAEEGLLFYANAWTLPWWQALFYQHVGYVSFIANAAGLLAYLAPVKQAPYVSSGVALLMYCFAAALVVFAKDAWLQKRIVVFAALLLIATPPGTEEVWLNSINSQSVLIVCVGLILALEPRDGAFGGFQKFLLLLAPLSSPGTWCLSPFFFLRALLDRSWPRALQGGILLCGVLIQMAFFFTPAKRDFGIDPLFLNAVILTKHVLLPLLGHEQASALAGHVSSFLTGSPRKWLLFFVIPFFLAAGAITATKPRQPALWFFLAGVTVAAVSYIFADGKAFLISVSGAARYAYAPQVLLGLAALSWAVTQSGISAMLARVLVVWLVVVGAYDYFRPSAPSFAKGPNWGKQVERWESDPAYRLKIWPRGWTMQLPSAVPTNSAPATVP